MIWPKILSRAVLTLLLFLLPFEAMAVDSPFPIGMYHVDPSDYPKMKEKGINLLQAVLHERSISTAKANGLNLLGALYPGMKFDLEYITNTVIKYKDEKSVYAWYLFDEPDMWNIKPTEIEEAYRIIKSIDGSRPVYFPISPMGTPELYINYVDVIGVDKYPIPESGPLEVYKNISSLRQKIGNEKPIWAVIQAFPKKNRRPPTSSELRAMVYLALINGAKGILYHSFTDPGWKLSANAELWGAIGEVNQEISRLSKVLLSGTKVSEQVECENPAIKFMLLKTGEKTYLFTVSSLSSSVKVSYKVKGEYAEEIFKGYAKKITDHVMEDYYEAYEAKVYMIH